jgi:PPM family protein phosphatase
MEIAVGSKPSPATSGTVDDHIAEVIAPGVVLLAVADGFGSVRGQSAPSVAVTGIRDALRRRLRPDGKDARASLIAAFSNANARVFARSGSNDDHVASGTSLTAALIVGDRAHIAHVGRTRAYLGRDGALSPLTTDDELDRNGWLRPRSNAPTDALAGHLLTRTLGTQPTLDATVGSVRLMHGDALVLATAAFHENVAESEVVFALRSADTSESVAQRLLALCAAREARNGGTIIIGRALTDPGTSTERSHGSVAMRRATAALVVLVMLSMLATALVHAFVGP